LAPFNFIELRNSSSSIVAAFFPCFFQLVAAFFCLPAVLTVTPLRLAQILFGFVDASLAPVITIARLQWRGTP
jgi:hypothetical protein